VKIRTAMLFSLSRKRPEGLFEAAADGGWRLLREQNPTATLTFDPPGLSDKQPILDKTH
jgi:hypothetical protein